MKGYLPLLVVPLFLVLILFACAPEPPPNRTGLRAVTAVPTMDMNDSDVLCDAATTHWGRDWPATIRALEGLAALDARCTEGFVLSSRLYSAHIAYGTLLEQRGRRQDAIRAYEVALQYNTTGREAVQRLQQLRGITPEPPPGCEPQVVSGMLSTLPGYTPTTGSFVQINGRRFTLNDQTYNVYGVNYYPRDFPERRFLTQMDVEQVGFELDLIRAAGLNTLRIFLRHDDLFTCPGDGAIPVPVNFARLDSFIHQAAEHGFKLILVLNHDPDLSAYPLYHSPAHTMQQMTFIAHRYRDEPAVMAYDLRDNGDADYAGSARFSQADVVTWLAQSAGMIRETAPDQLVTVGWDNDSAMTAPLVDFVSFQHFGGVESLRQEIAVLTNATSKPILLTAVGYNTFDMDELGQRQAFQRAFEAVERNGLAGWVVWTAFDYPLSVLCVEPDCPAEDGPSARFGIWNTSYFPKRALDAIEQVTGVTRDES